MIIRVSNVQISQLHLEKIMQLYLVDSVLVKIIIMRLEQIKYVYSVIFLVSNAQEFLIPNV